MEFKSSNPFLKENKFKNTSRTNDEAIAVHQETMTVSGTINKSFTMLFMLLSTALVSWWLVGNGYNPMIFTIGGGIVGLILVLIASFKPTTSPYTAPAYALFEGLFIGGLSAVFEAMYPGLVIQAVSATFITFLVCFGLYKYNIVKVTETFKSVVIGATMAIFAFYLISWIASMFMTFQPIHQGNSLMSIGISVFVIIVAALNLFLDFDMIEKGSKTGAPKYMEWFASMGLMITLVWLYVEFLRLFAKLSSRD
ncbi:Bax inhibitor-1/YccA family protein [Flavobacterium gelidilacus]|uniref:Bax inhibitor-1/YccA family protein n=1 Tax=Flavobacterium gelidilacus TaxID=206041 RepID=UPI00040579E0|nr:Bax inhibitor-1/YccA family protein [Flavobacterium gelidilacus]